MQGNVQDKEYSKDEETLVRNKLASEKIVAFEAALHETKVVSCTNGSGPLFLAISNLMQNYVNDFCVTANRSIGSCT